MMGKKEENLSLYEDVVGEGEKTTDLSQLRLYKRERKQKTSTKGMK